MIFASFLGIEPHIFGCFFPFFLQEKEKYKFSNVEGLYRKLSVQEKNNQNGNQNSNTPFSIQFINYPQTLLKGSNSYTFQFNITNHRTSPETYEIDFSSDDFKLSNHESFKAGIELGNAETKQITLNAQPKKDGLSRLNVKSLWQKKVQYTEMVWKVRNQVEKDLIDNILSQSNVIPSDLDNYRSQLPQKIDTGDVPQISKEEAKKKVEELNTLSQKAQSGNGQNISSPSEIQEQGFGEKRPGQEDSLGDDGGSLNEGTANEVGPNERSANERSANEVGPSEGSANVKNVQKPALTDAQKDGKLLEIARGVFMEDSEYGFKVLSQIKNEETRNTWLEHMIPTGILLDYQSTLSVVMDMDDEKKNKYFEMLAYATGPVNPNDAIMIALNLEDVEKRDQIIKDILFKALDTNPDIAFNAIYQINNEKFQRKVLFELIKRTSAIDKEKAINSLKSLIDNILSGANQEFIKNCMIFLAHLTSPQSVYDLIEKFDDSQKKIIQDQLKEHLKVQVEETRTKIVPEVVTNTFFQIPTIVNDITKSIEDLIEKGGMISPNLLANSHQTDILIVAPFKYNFPVGMSFFQSYLQILQERQKIFSYIVYPSEDLTNQVEKDHLFRIITDLIRKNSNVLRIPTKVILFDLIPYLSKPTVLLGNGKEDNTEGIQQLERSLDGVLQDHANIKINNTSFIRGQLLNEIKSKLSNKKFQIQNIILTYNFLNQFPLLKAFFNGLLG